MDSTTAQKELTREECIARQHAAFNTVEQINEIRKEVSDLGGEVSDLRTKVNLLEPLPASIDEVKTKMDTNQEATELLFKTEVTDVKQKLTIMSLKVAVSGFAISSLALAFGDGITESIKLFTTLLKVLPK